MVIRPASFWGVLVRWAERRVRSSRSRVVLEDLIQAGETDRFDIAFVDADKTNYLNYYERCLKLLRPGGLVMFDNTLWGGSVADPTDQDQDTVALRELNDWLHQDRRVSISLVPIGDGLTLARKR